MAADRRDPTGKAREEVGTASQEVTMPGGYMGKVLEVDLSRGTSRSYSLPDRMLELYVGNKGLGARLLYEMLPPGVDPMSPDNILIVTTAAMTGTGAPSTNRFNVTSRSPATGLIVNSNSGGDFGVRLKQAGYDALIIKGKAPKPSYISIRNEDVSIEDAAGLWGLDTEQTQERLPGKTGKMVIGPAGENLVKFAGIFSQERVAGRAGIGTVMGSKNLKAVVAGGDRRPAVADPEKYKEVCGKWREVLKNHPATGESMPAYGTAGFVNVCNATYTMPTRNFQHGQFDECDKVSGETLAETALTKNTACYGCVIACGRRVEVDGKKVKGPEYETLGLFGPNLCNSDLGAILRWNYECDLLGMDSISAGNVLGFVMEAGEKGLLKTDLAFGKIDNISKALEDIAFRRGLGDDMAEGVRSLSEKYGGKEFAIQSKGLEIPSYEPRGAVGHGLGYAVSNRGGCHLAGGYMIYLEANGPITVKPLAAIGKPGLNILNQTMLEAVSTLGCCNFTIFTMLHPLLLKYNARSQLLAKMLSAGFLYSGDVLGAALSLPHWTIPVPPPFSMFPQVKAHATCTGKYFTMGKFIELGQRSFNIDHLFNIREGFSARDDTLPRRLTDELQRAEEPDSRVPLEKMKPRYYWLRGWKRDGTIKDRTLARLKIER